MIELARTLGWRVYYVPDSRHVSDRGFPDLTMIHEAKRRLVFAELKTEKGKVRPEQEIWLGVLKDVGVEVHLWRPADMVTGAIPKTLMGVE